MKVLFENVICKMAAFVLRLSYTWEGVTISLLIEKIIWKCHLQNGNVVLKLSYTFSRAHEVLPLGYCGCSIKIAIIEINKIHSYNQKCKSICGNEHSYIYIYVDVMFSSFMDFVALAPVAPLLTWINFNPSMDM